MLKLSIANNLKMPKRKLNGGLEPKDSEVMIIFYNVIEDLFVSYILFDFEM